MKEVECPIAIFHGTQDKVINVNHGKELATIHPTRTQLNLAENKNHRRIIFDGSIRQILGNLK